MTRVIAETTSRRYRIALALFAGVSRYDLRHDSPAR